MQVFFAKTSFVISHKNSYLILCMLLKMKLGLAFFPVLYGTFPLGNSQGNLQIIKNTYF